MAVGFIINSSRVLLEYESKGDNLNNALVGVHVLVDLCGLSVCIPVAHYDLSSSATGPNYQTPITLLLCSREKK